MQRVQPALDRGAAGRPEGPALGTGVPAFRLALDDTGALECQPKRQRLALVRNGHWSADRILPADAPLP
eukprot:210965-Prymnesium_polylepis.1